MTWIVATGTNGFIGTNILEKLLAASPSDFGLDASKEPLSIVAADLPSSCERATFRRFANHPRVTFLPHTELISYIERAKTPPLCIIHNGACSSTVEQDPNVFATLNVNSSKALWEVATRRGVPFIYASSAAVYGDGSKGFIDAKELCSQYRPLNLYGKSKHDFDLWTLEQKETPPLWFGLRYFNVYGPWESHKGGQASMVLHGFHQAQRNGVIRLFKSDRPDYAHGAQLRDFVSVRDVVAVTLALTKKAILHTHDIEKTTLENNGLFLNVGTGSTQTWNTLAGAVFEALEIPTKIEYIPMPSDIAAHYQYFTQADLNQLRQILPTFQPTSLREGIHSYVRDFLTQAVEQSF